MCVYVYGMSLYATNEELISVHMITSHDHTGKTSSLQRSVHNNALDKACDSRQKKRSQLMGRTRRKGGGEIEGMYKGI